MMQAIVRAWFTVSVLILTLAACNSPSVPLDTSTPEYMTVTTSIAHISTKGVVSTLGTTDPTNTPTVQPITKSVTPTPEPTNTPTASPTPTILPTPTFTPTQVVGLQVAQICGIDRASPPQVNHQTLYFRPFMRDWYRTSDRFTTVEWVAPAGALSSDLETLVVFGCNGPGSICVAAPPQSEPIPLSLYYEPREGGQNGATWLSGSRKLIFAVGYVPPDRSVADITLYLLDLQIPELYRISDHIWPDWAVSPLGTCVAYSIYDPSSPSERFRLTNVEDPEFETLIFAEEDIERSGPDWDDDIAWSPDGSHLAFHSKQNFLVIWDLVTGTYKEYRSKPEGSFPRNLKWSPEGDRIYFVSGGSGNSLAHWILDLESEEFRELAKTSMLALPNDYQWLPGGEEMVVPGIFGSVLLDVNGGAIERLTYPGSEEYEIIRDIFLGPAPP